MLYDKKYIIERVQKEFNNGIKVNRSSNNFIIRIY